MDKIRDKIRSWPRWVRYGLLSVAVALLSYLVANIFPYMSLIQIGIVAPLFIIGITTTLEWPTLLTYPILIGFWFLLGALLGRFIDRIGYAILVWFVVYFIGATLYLITITIWF